MSDPLFIKLDGGIHQYKVKNCKFLSIDQCHTTECTGPEVIKLF